MAGPLVTAALISGALLLTLVAPRVLARWTLPRASPGAGLFLWQALSLSGVAFALLAAPVAALTVGTRFPWLLSAALLVSASMVAGLLWSGHRIGSDLRRMRAEHRRLIDLVGEHLDGERPEHLQRTAVIAHASPTAYCLPGRHDRIVLSRAAVDRLTNAELEAVLEHERAHLAARHDLLLELFTVLHSTVPDPIRSKEALREVHLLVEALADRVALTKVSAPTLARALVAMATTGPREAGGRASAAETGQVGPERHLQPGVAGTPALAAVGGTDQVRVRLGLLAGPTSRPGLRVILVTVGAVVLLLPWGLAFSQV